MDQVVPPENALALIQKFRQHGRHDEPYADSTQDGLSHIRRRWTDFCHEARLGEPTAALRSARAPEFKAFFQWVILNPERGAQQAQTLKQYFRVLKMLYSREARTTVDPEVVRDVNTFIKYHAAGKKKSSPRPKPVATGEDVVRMLHYLYKTDQATYPDERQRVQQGFLILTHAFSGLRPSSTTKTGTKHSRDKNPVKPEQEDAPLHETEELVKLRYNDMKIVVTTDEHGCTRFAVCPTFTHFKGNLKRTQHKTFTWFDKPDVLTCPVAHLVALALFDNAFWPPSLCDARSVFSLTAPHGKMVTLPWRQDVLNTPIFRESSVATSNIELSGSVALRRLTTLGQNMGYRLPVTWYCFRRLVLNAVDGFGSEEIRNQVAGHLESRTYRNSYQNQRIELDVSSLVLGQASEDTLIKQLNVMGADADPAANVPLPLEAHDQIAALPDIIALRHQYELAAEAPETDPLAQERKSRMQKLRAKKEFYRSRMKAHLREEYFEQKNLMLIEEQLGDIDGKRRIPEAREPWIPMMPERAELASLADTSDIRCAEMLEARIAAVQAMADLCSRVEPAKGSVPRQADLSKKATPTPPKAVVANELPLRCHELQCLFCVGDERLQWKDRTRIFGRLQALWKHARIHLSRLENGQILCPHPRCKTPAVTLTSVEHLLNHAQRLHNVRLRSR